MRVGLTGNSSLFRSGLKALLNGVGVAVPVDSGDPHEFVALVAAERPDAVITDVRAAPSSREEGMLVAAAVKRRCPSVGVLVLSADEQADGVARLLESGPVGVGYLLEDEVDDIRSVVDALERLRAGQTVLDPRIVAQLISREQRMSGIAALSEREREVLGHMADGRSNSGIGRALSLAPRTVESYIAGIFTKLQIPASRDTNRRVLAVQRWRQPATGGASLCASRSAEAAVVRPGAGPSETRSSAGRWSGRECRGCTARP